MRNEGSVISGALLARSVSAGHGVRVCARCFAFRMLLVALLAAIFSLSPVLFVLESRVTALSGLLSGRTAVVGTWAFDVFAQESPGPVGFVNDFADVIPQGVEARTEAVALELERKTTAEIVVVTVATTGGIDVHDYSVELFTRWKIGKQGKDNGILILAAIQDKKLWIKTGYGLEHAIPDAVASRVYRDVLRPAFREGDYGGGLLLAVQIIASRIAEYEDVTLTSVDSLGVFPQARVAETGARRLVAVFVFLTVAVLLTLVRMRGARSRRYIGFPFWTMGGFSGGMRGGSFGGGFGGFGGGGCGGGGAGGGW